MKKMLLLAAVAIVLASCTKQGIAPVKQDNPKPPHGGPSLPIATLTIAIDTNVKVTDTAKVSDTFATPGVVTLGFSITAGESDILAPSVPITLTSSVDPANIAISVDLYDNATTIRIASKDVMLKTPVLILTGFPDVPAHATKYFTLKANVKPIGTTFTEKDYFGISITSSNVAAIVATDPSGNPLTSDHLAGSAIGKNIYFKE